MDIFGPYSNVKTEPFDNQIHIFNLNSGLARYSNAKSKDLYHLQLIEDRIAFHDWPLKISYSGDLKSG